MFLKFIIMFQKCNIVLQLCYIVFITFKPNGDFLEVPMPPENQCEILKVRISEFN